LSLNGGTLGWGPRGAGSDSRKLDYTEGWPSGKALASKAKVGLAHRGFINNGKREALEGRFSTRVLTTNEFIELLGL